MCVHEYVRTLSCPVIIIGHNYYYNPVIMISHDYYHDPVIIIGHNYYYNPVIIIGHNCDSDLLRLGAMVATGRHGPSNHPALCDAARQGHSLRVTPTPRHACTQVHTRTAVTFMQVRFHEQTLPTRDPQAPHAGTHAHKHARMYACAHGGRRRRRRLRSGCTR